MQVTQRDLQREFHLARQNATEFHRIPDLAISSSLAVISDLPGIRRTFASTRHLYGVPPYRETRAYVARGLAFLQQFRSEHG